MAAGNITFGGRPSLEQKMAFSNLKEGSQVPGYRGYISQLKYRIGKTYGEQTHELSKDCGRYSWPSALPNLNSSDKIKAHTRPLPKSSGDNKYTERMVPGYTGFVPRIQYLFGGTYRDDCDRSITDHISNMDAYRTKVHDLRTRASLIEPLTSQSADPHVRDHMNSYQDKCTTPNNAGEKRNLTEPPIPGYQGYVPRIKTTETGLGLRYHEASKNGLVLFDNETNYHRSKQVSPNSISIERVPGVSKPFLSKRLYLNDGMIPKYTGYLPQMKYNFGQTYGDTSRSLEVCAHP